jgi:hypothetical protein
MLTKLDLLTISGALQGQIISCNEEIKTNMVSPHTKEIIREVASGCAATLEKIGKMQKEKI